MVDDTVKARKQPMGKGPKGGRMPYESDGESVSKTKKAMMEKAKAKQQARKETKAKAKC
jgi:hypothetical protein